MAEDDDSKILESIKAMLGLQPDYTPFDTELVMHINSVLATLNQLGVGPETGFIITSNSVWSDLLVDSKIENVKSYIYLRVRMLFDPPTVPALISSFERQILEQEWRLTVATDPMIPQLEPDIDEDDVPIIIDGGEI